MLIGLQVFDAAFRTRLEKPLDRAAAGLERTGVSPNAMTAIGLALGVLCCVVIAQGRWWLGLALWIANRMADGLDGPLARRKGATEFGGFFDIVADFAIYGGVLVAIGIDRPDARLACLVVFLTYYLSGSAFLAFSSMAARREAEGDGRSLIFPAGLAEGSETIAAYIIILALPAEAVTLLWVWAAIVGITLMQRICMVARLLKETF